MWFWAYMLAMDLIVPFVMIGFGHCFAKRAPNEIGTTFGYRTARSMKSRAAWEFAHQYVGKLWQVCGWLLLAGAVAAMLPTIGRSIAIVGIAGGVVCGVQIAVMVGTIFPTESALKRNFDSAGRQR